MADFETPSYLLMQTLWPDLDFYLIHITDFDSQRIITFTIARLRSHLNKSMIIHPGETRYYIQCKNCLENQPLIPEHIFECPTFTPRELEIGLNIVMDPLQDILCSQNAPEAATAIVVTFSRF
ncbi:hypothetical protein TNIN_316251 [Trichonephila inaurata madagascariensis]|uniref:Uncharacterized protein n=1 Tax=Trichonephila inaurata madagascariensis TaxID=2747483 RepID=A0A8X7C7L9_9ARAC|nr:hypothetical protein TNIN_316251 [Trichonephila inaurata madagascariensis]